MIVKSAEEMMRLGEEFGRRLHGGEIIELIGDVGAGKTTFVKGLAKGLEVEQEIQSPSFTISRTYAARDGLNLNHYDFYRLDNPGIMKTEIVDSLNQPMNITVVEWAKDVSKVLPEERKTINIEYLPEAEEREVSIK